MKLNDLTDVTITTPATVVNYYHYDGNGMRYCKTDSGGTTYYTYDGLNPILERNGSGAVQAHYTHGRSDIAGIGSLTVAKRNGSHQYPHMDQIGSVRNLTDDSETVVQYYEYDAFGNELESAGSQTNLIRYSSHILDEDTELIYNFARQYEPDVGRFSARDVMRFRNCYVFVDNRPSGLADINGAFGCAAEKTPEDLRREAKKRREEEEARRMLDVAMCAMEKLGWKHQGWGEPGLADYPDSYTSKIWFGWRYQSIPRFSQWYQEIQASGASASVIEDVLQNAMWDISHEDIHGRRYFLPRLGQAWDETLTGWWGAETKYYENQGKKEIDALIDKAKQQEPGKECPAILETKRCQKVKNRWQEIICECQEQLRRQKHLAEDEAFQLIMGAF